VAFCRGRLLTGGWDNAVNVWRLGQQEQQRDATTASDEAPDSGSGASSRRRRPPPVTAHLVSHLPVAAWVYGMAPLLSSDGGDGGERLLLGCSGGAYPDVQARCAAGRSRVQQAAAARGACLRRVLRRGAA
jgi:hypothetical protein